MNDAMTCHIMRKNRVPPLCAINPVVNRTFGLGFAYSSRESE